MKNAKSKECGYSNILWFKKGMQTAKRSIQHRKTHMRLPARMPQAAGNCNNNYWMRTNTEANFACM